MPSSISTSREVSRHPRRVLASIGAFACGCAALVSAAELILRLLPVSTSTSTGYYIDPLIRTYPPHRTFTVSTGWDLRNARHHVANNYGFLDTEDFSRGTDAVAVIGDSHVEANMLKAEDTLATQLKRRLAGRETHAMGAPGTSLLDYAERIRFATTVLGVRDVVLFLERGDVVQAICGSGNIAARCISRESLKPVTVLLPAQGHLKRILSRSAFLQYLYSQLKFDPGAVKSSIRTYFGAQGARLFPRKDERKVTAPPQDPPQEQVAAVVERFMDAVRKYKPRTLIVLYYGGSGARPNAPMDTLRDAVVAENAAFVDLSGMLADAEKSAGLSVHVSPSDPHLNRIGLGLAADVAADLLERQQHTAESSKVAP